MLKKAMLSGIVFSSILLVGYNKEEIIDITENKENDANVMSESKELNLISEFKTEIMASITEQTELDSESIEGIMVSGSPVKGIIDISISFPKNTKVDDKMIKQIIKDSIKKVSETENITISEENITIKIEKL
ncbi:topoisomerase [Lysinibacillus sphaericus]|uniref:topoisomerase n=1 Tax=Lysinibacillus sphaericus TaxID=1421 RepID=UPI0021614D89|nr:topoisomerase [Lysinibacillus sphaericus]MCS1382826.1 topoisomerase [Lysinibacillus sphaericus]